MTTWVPDEDDDLPPLPSGAGNVKLQRWVDLVAALLSRHAPASFLELAGDVPAYALRLEAHEREPDARARATIMDSLKRTFERDKDELRAFGIPIESREDGDGAVNGVYQLKRTDFYLPYLCVAAPDGGVTTPPKVDSYGYQALKSLTFDADELQAVVDAAAGVRALGEPLLASHVESAMRKLAVDLPFGSALPSPDAPALLAPRSRASSATFEALGDALRRRKVVTFEYHAMSSDRTDVREVEPYGLFFLSGHWYLVGRDRGRGELRNFRLNRMARAEVNTRKAQSADYEVPATFRLRDHARSRHAWELGDGDAVRAVVAFDGGSGPTMAAMKLGGAVEGTPTHRTFDVRRIDAFARWLLSFAGELTPMAPAALVAAYREEVGATAAIYDAPAATEHITAAGGTDAATNAGKRGAAEKAWEPKGAAAQLRRILHLVPHIANGEELALHDVAARLGTSVEELQRDLYSLVDRYDMPGGFVEGVQLYVGSDTVSAVTNHLRRPMRLTVAELCALELGLAVLRSLRAPDERQALERARERLRAVIARLPGDPIPDGLHGASLGDVGNTAHLVVVREALRKGRKLRLAYRRSGSQVSSERTIAPYLLLSASGMLYIVAFCEREQTTRLFRIDRVESVALIDETFERPDAGVLDTLRRERRAFQGDGAPTMRVRYSPRIARWIAEREGKALAADGSLEMEHPLADWEWGMRHVLQYGRDAEVVEPAALRERLKARLDERLAVLAR